MPRYRIISRITLTAPREYQVVVSAIPTDMRSAEVRSDTVPTLAEAEVRRDYLVISLGTDLRARGHDISGIVE